MIANIDLIAHLLEVWSLSVCFPQIYCFWEVLSCTFLLVTPRMVNLHRRCQWLFTPSKRFYLFRFFSQFPLGPFQVFVGLLKINSGFQPIPSGPYSSIFFFAGHVSWSWCTDSWGRLAMPRSGKYRLSKRRKNRAVDLPKCPSRFQSPAIVWDVQFSYCFPDS